MRHLVTKEIHIPDAVQGEEYGPQIYEQIQLAGSHDSGGNYTFDAGELWDAEQYLPAGGVLHFYPEIWTPKLDDHTVWWRKDSTTTNGTT
jgi:hypothetical protein